MSWLKKLLPTQIRIEGRAKRNVPEGLWVKCTGCNAVLYRTELDRNHDVCPKCAYHMRQNIRRRLDQFLDKEPRIEIGEEIQPLDILQFKDSKKYRDRLSAAQKATGETDALIAMMGCVKKVALIACGFEFSFLGGSMGSVVGERFVRSVELCIKHETPLVCFSASGGARMQEALFSLMQMAKTSAALARLRQQHLPFVSVLTDPTTGGVSASLAMLGDVNIAEPGALIGFAGPRVIEQTVGEKLPAGFQRSEFLLQHGALDMIVDRRDMRHRVATILAIMTKQPPV